MIDWVELGYWGLFLISFLAATVLPLSSDAVLGAMMVGPFEPVWLLVVASIGNWLGGVSSYLLGYYAKLKWIEKFLRVSQETIQRNMKWVNKYGAWLAFFTWLPIIGDPIAVVLGLAKSKVLPTFLLMFIGKALRYLVIIYVIETMVKS